MSISTRLTELFGLEHPIISAPMAFAAGGKLASAVSSAGALGLIGCGYGDEPWINEQFGLAEEKDVGCGFITWSLAERPQLLELALSFSPRAIFLSFGDPSEPARAIKRSGAKLICQVQSLEDVRRAVDSAADVVVAQGAEAGGHGELRGTMNFVPEVADWLRCNSPETLLCAAGGIADGRGLAASLMLGADGVVMGSRFWATQEALVHRNMHDAAKRANGDETIRSSVMDIVRNKPWPNRFTARVLRNRFTDEWHGRESELASQSDSIGPRWEEAWAKGDVSIANTFIGEATGLINEIDSAAELVGAISAQASKLLSRWRQR